MHLSVYATSDLHGYPLDQFKTLLKKADFCDDDFLYYGKSHKEEKWRN